MECRISTDGYILECARSLCRSGPSTQRNATQLWIHFDKSGSKGKMLEISKNFQITHHRQCIPNLLRIFQLLPLIRLDFILLVYKTRTPWPSPPTPPPQSSLLYTFDSALCPSVCIGFVFCVHLILMECIFLWKFAWNIFVQSSSFSINRKLSISCNFSQFFASNTFMHHLPTWLLSSPSHSVRRVACYFFFRFYLFFLFSLPHSHFKAEIEL